MAHNVKTPETDIMVETKGKLELFFDKHGNKLLWLIIIVGIAVSGYFIVKNYIDSRSEANEQSASIAMANELNGADSVEGYAKVQEEYEGTAAATLLTSLLPQPLWRLATSLRLRLSWLSMRWLRVLLVR